MLLVNQEHQDYKELCTHNQIIRNLAPCTQEVQVRTICLCIQKIVVLPTVVPKQYQIQYIKSLPQFLKTICIKMIIFKVNRVLQVYREHQDYQAVLTRNQHHQADIP